MRFLLFLPALSILIVGCSDQSSTAARTNSPIDLWDARPTDARTYLNPNAARALGQIGEKVTEPTTAEIAALQDSSAWRRLDRADRYEAVLLAGQPAETGTLARHLAESPDFRIERVDHQGFLFRRGLPSPYRPAPVDKVAPDLTDPTERAAVLAACAVNLDLIGSVASSRDYLAAAEGLAPDLPNVHVCAATIDLRHERYAAAIEGANLALDVNPDSVPALQIAAQALAAAGQPDAAWQIAEKLIAVASPDDTQTLFLHARLASDAHAFSREQASLERLVEISEKADLPATTYRVYLGQSFARQGLPRPAIKQFQAALADPNLGAAQRTDLESTITNIKEKTGL